MLSTKVISTYFRTLYTLLTFSCLKGDEENDDNNVERRFIENHFEVFVEEIHHLKSNRFRCKVDNKEMSTRSLMVAYLLKEHRNYIDEIMLKTNKDAVSTTSEYIF